MADVIVHIPMPDERMRNETLYGVGTSRPSCGPAYRLHVNPAARASSMRRIKLSRRGSITTKRDILLPLLCHLGPVLAGASLHQQTAFDIFCYILTF
jgi:hypothetical protein